MVLLDLAVGSLWVQVLRKRGTADAAYTLPVVGILISPHVFIYDLVMCLAAIPAVVNRPAKWSAPLIGTGFFIPWIAHLVLKEPIFGVFWLVLLLVFVMIIPAVPQDRSSHPQ